MTATFHEPVLVGKVIELLQPRSGDRLVDMNLGTGGHSLALLAACEGKGRLIGLDLDTAMLSLARQRFASTGIDRSCYDFVHADHADLSGVLGAHGWKQADRILMDLGASSLHFDTTDRGFSCQMDGPLDMRYNRAGEGPSAADIINEWSRDELARLFKQKGDERWAKKIASCIEKRRAEKPIQTTSELAELVGRAIPRKAWPPKIHPATRVFLALRVEVNQEEASLKAGLKAATDALAEGGRFAVITFQSNEDRTVKRFFRDICRDVVEPTDPFGRVSEPALFQDLTRKPWTASETEVEANPRSRSAKLRGVERKATA